MEGFAVLLIVLVVGSLLSGPIALIVAIVALQKASRLEESHARRAAAAPPALPRKEVAPAPEKPKETPIEKTPPPAPVYRPQPPVTATPPAPPAETTPRPPVSAAPSPDSLSFEQRFGTRWLLIAGIVSVIAAAGYFLKYAYDHDWLGPWMRVGIVAAGGLIGLVLGEFTRRRGYEVVARGTTALGFALLYAASFAAYRVYDLVSPVPAFAAAVLITLGAMTYAAVLNEVLIAFLSLLGGYLTPILVSTGENLPIPLFSYVLVLSLGAMAIGYLRRWRSVNIAAFAGTYLLYVGWFIKFCVPVLDEPAWQAQKPVALAWLAVFFVVYLLMPLMYGLLRKAKARPEDVLLVLSTGLATIALLWIMLYESDRTELATWCAALGVVYLAVKGLIDWRCPEDMELRSVLLVTGISFLTAAAAFTWTRQPLIIAWALEGVVLTLIGIRYSNLLIKVLSVIVLALSVGCLLTWLVPLHDGPFTLVRTPEFGTWMFVAAAVLASHFFWRFSKTTQPEERLWMTDLLYTCALLLAAFACVSEWVLHCEYNVVESARALCLHVRLLVIAAILAVLCLVRPLCPRGTLCGLSGGLTLIAASVFAVVSLAEVYRQAFTLFLNLPFLAALLIPLALLLTGWRIGRQEGLADENRPIVAECFALAAIVLTGILLTEQVYLYWNCKHRFAGPVDNWTFLAHLSVSLLWALYATVLILIGFVGRKRSIRYVALALFTLLLGKIFLFDTVNLETGYRIAAFLVTGLVLLAVSYLYQFAKKRGVFDTLLSQIQEEKTSS